VESKINIKNMAAWL